MQFGPKRAPTRFLTEINETLQTMLTRGLSLDAPSRFVDRLMGKLDVAIVITVKKSISLGLQPGGSVKTRGPSGRAERPTQNPQSWAATRPGPSIVFVVGGRLAQPVKYFKMTRPGRYNSQALRPGPAPDNIHIGLAQAGPSAHDTP